MITTGLQLHAAPAIVMTPQLRQSLHLLQLPALEFGQAVQAALVANPFLEPGTDGGAERDLTHLPMESDRPAANGDAIDAPASAAPSSLSLDFEAGAGGWDGGSRGDGDAWPDANAGAAEVTSLRAHLHRQIGASRLSDQQRLLADMVAEAVDDDGYLRVSLAEIAGAFPEQDVDLPVLEQALRFVQTLDPAGVAARTPGECLALQLEALPGRTPQRSLALRLVREHLALLARHDAARLCSATGCDEDALREAHALIRQLDPHPGHRFGADDTGFVVADVLVEPADGSWQARINPQVLPRLRINRRCVQALRAASGGGNGAMAQQLQEARWLLRSVRQRYDTIARVAQAVVDRQRCFFAHGDIGMQPLLQCEIAQALELHPSTVSRVVQGKYMATPHGLLAFHRLFDPGVQAADGSPCAATAVRALIREMIAAEDHAQPLSDLKLMRRLAQRGVRVARRTVTKYRDAMGIEPWQARRLVRRAMARPDPVVPRN